jgi:hypothetical protein
MKSGFLLAMRFRFRVGGKKNGVLEQWSDGKLER